MAIYWPGKKKGKRLAPNATMSIATASVWLGQHERSESLVLIGAFAGAYYGLHQLTVQASKVLCPLGSKDGEWLDAPQPKYGGAPLRKILGARSASFVHAILSFAASARVVALNWERLRSPARRLVRAWPRWLGASLNGALPALAYDVANGTTPGARAVLCHSVGYFAQELAHVLRHEPDPIFIAHHVAYLLATCPVLAGERGWAMVAVATVLAEITNPLQLAWEVTKACGFRDAHDALSLPFTVAFAACRGVLMPLCMLDIAAFLATRKEADPTMKWCFGLFAVGIAASCLWVAQLVSGYRKYQRKKRAAAAANAKK